MPTAIRSIRPPKHLRSHFAVIVAATRATRPADSFPLDLGNGLSPPCQAGWFSMLVSQALVGQPPGTHPSSLIPHPSPPTDLELTQRYLASLQFHQLPEPEHAAAWLRFYACHAPRIRRIVSCSGIDRASVDDCTQEVWTELAVKLPLFVLDPARGTFAGWLRRVTRRKSLEYRRRWNRFGRLRFDADYDLARLCCPRLPEPAPAAEMSELRQRVRELLAEFEHRESRLNWLILHSCTVKGRSAAETAQRLNVPVKHVSERHCRTRRRLRSFLERRLGVVG